MIAYTGGRSAPIPFQVDPRDEKGFVFGASPMLGTTPPGRMGKFDEIAFMVSDLGERRTQLQASTATVTTWEIEVMVGGDKWYGYLYLYPRPQRSSVDYVSYQRDANRERVITPRYLQSFVPEEAFFADLQVRPPDGNNRDMYDKLKMRARVTSVGGIVVEYDETDFHSHVTGLRDGPVRVIRQNRTVIDLFFGLRTPEALVDEIFWRDMFEVPSELRLPYGADIVLNGFDYYQGCDLLRASGPFTFVADAGGPVTVDGKMSPAEIKLAGNPADHHWGMVSGQAGSVFYAFDWIARSAPVKLRLFYRDDAITTGGAESERGDSMYGFRLENGLALTGAGQKINIRVFILPRGTTVDEAKGLLTPAKARVMAMGD